MKTYSLALLGLILFGSAFSLTKPDLAKELLNTIVLSENHSVSENSTPMAANSTTVNVTTSNIQTEIALTVFLEGAYLDGTGEMSTELVNSNLLPLSQPYNAPPYDYTGTESLSAVNATMVDWVLVEVRTGIDPSDCLEVKAGILLKDGAVKSSDGVNDLSFDLSAGESYYILIRHRNHLDIMSSVAVPYATSMAYDFTTQVSQAYGNLQLKAMNDGQIAMFAGDINYDWVIQVTDYDVWQNNPAVLGTYEFADLNLDGTIQVTDYDLWFGNKAKLAPSEVEYEHNQCIINGIHAAFAEFDSGSYTIYQSGNNIVMETDGLPNHTSPYWSNTTERCLQGPPGGPGGGGTICTNSNTLVDHPLFVAPTVTNYNQMAPGNIDDFNGSYSLTIPASPQLASSSSSTGLGAIGFAVSGSVIYNDEEGPNVPLDNAVGSLDYTAAHTGPQSYHYHLEPHAWSQDDDLLIGIISDGFFLYGRKCASTGAYPTDLDASGGHTSMTQHSCDPEYHYHIQNELYLGEYYILFPGDYQGTPNNIQ